MIKFTMEYGESITKLLYKPFIKLYKNLIKEIGIKNFMEKSFYYFKLIFRFGITIGGFYFIIKLIWEMAHEAMRNRPLIYWILFCTMTISTMLIISPQIAGTFHITRVRASSAPWVEKRLLYVFIGGIIQFGLGTYLVSLLCLFPGLRKLNK